MPKNSKIVKKYPKVLNALRLKIRRGDYVGMLPGVQQLARDFDVNFMTVNKAVNMLVDENLLYRIPNKGTFVRRTYRVALVFLSRKDGRNQGRLTVYDDLIHGVEEALNEKKLTMVFKNIDPETELLSLKNMKNESDGVILLGDLNPRLDKTLDDFPAVRVMGAADDNDNRDHVTFNNYSIGRLAAEHMRRKGHSECAFVCSNDRQLLLDRGTAFCETLAKAGGHASMIIPGIPNIVNGLKIDAIAGQLAKMLNEKPVPTGLFIPAAWMAGSICSFLNSRGVIPGKDIEIVTCDKELMELSKLTPLPAYVDTHADLVGKKAVEMLSRRIEFPDSPPKKILLEPELMENMS